MLEAVTRRVKQLSITGCSATRIQRSQVKRVDAAKIGDTLGDLGLMAGDPPSHGALGGKKDMPRDKCGILFATNVPALFRCQQEMLDSRDHPQPAFPQSFRLGTGTKRQFFEKNSFKPDVLRQLPVHYHFRNEQLFEKRHVRPDLRESLVSRLLQFVHANVEKKVSFVFGIQKDCAFANTCAFRNFGSGSRLETFARKQVRSRFFDAAQLVQLLQLTQAEAEVPIIRVVPI